MIENTKAIVINALKFGETSLIVTCYTKKKGRKSYILKGILKSKRGKLKSAYFQPLMHLMITANHNNSGKLNHIKEVEVLSFYQHIYTDVKKQCIALFISEVLFSAIQEEEANENLFQYLETALQWLDLHQNSSDFHLLFLLNLTKYLGFYPAISNSEMRFFNLENGAFTNYESKNNLAGDKLILFKQLLGINFDALNKLNYNAQSRQMILLILVQYYELHLSGFKKPKSLAVLKSVFS
ncbi:MAG: DNA repair protein RecO [Lutibacter sp.]